jgi:hypothetical protein
VKRCPMRRNNLTKMLGYRRDSHGQPVNGKSEQLCLNPGVCVGLLRRIVTAEGPEVVHGKVSLPCKAKTHEVLQGLFQPHTGKATVTGTGTRQPSSCGKRPKAVGESVMRLPGNFGSSAWQGVFPLTRLTGKGCER